MKKNSIITTANLDDIDMLVQLFENYRLFYGKNQDTEKATKFLKERLVNNESVVFIAKDYENPSIGLGFVQLYPSFSSVSMKKIWILNDLYVEEKARRKRVASQLMEKAEEFVEQSGSEHIVLETAIDNKNAQCLYEKIGYLKETNFYTYELVLPRK
ncbi:GNAT family N-acetyltransferase [Aquibacillus rhizosphaerae]|uniref:GNAT family N-acetyltransferase n=1 Tax=Aquibacillus rhizosphaerae TaxID=3051431 RepID=A0ABT7L7P7_9BACI|nr:GNAT family N-acetyltransferase [Aquibacillus sp. LR5S19]MDL4841235.1 GNAT family N-acetyltransferase [Aquibacillus sp. LR5S19]